VLQLRREQSGPSCAPLRVLAQNDRQARAESPTIAAPTTARGEIAFPRRVFLSFYPSPPSPHPLSFVNIDYSIGSLLRESIEIRRAIVANANLCYSVTNKVGIELSQNETLLGITVAVRERRGGRARIASGEISRAGA